jgi:predicted nucleotidyltransferase
MLPPAIAQDLQCFLRVLHSRYGEDLVSVVLFGSWARGEARAESDIDLLVISKHFPGSRLDRHRDMFEAVKAVTKDFASRASIIPLTPEEASTTKPLRWTPSSRQKRAIIKIDCYTYEPKYTAAGV